MISVNKLKKIGELAFKNAIRFHQDSILLYKKYSYDSAYFLSILAIEELGKMYMTEKSLSWEGGLGEYEQEFLKKFYDHKAKQLYFYNNSYFNNWLVSEEKLNLVNKVGEGYLERLKQKSMYVGLLRTKKTIDTEGRLSYPNAGRKIAFDQITVVSDEILSLIFGHIYEIYGIDNELVTQYFTKASFRNMQKIWTHKTPKAKKHFKKIVTKFLKENGNLKIT